MGRFIGNAWLKEHFGLRILPLTYECRLGPQQRTDASTETTRRTFTSQYDPGETAPDNLEFGLKYEPLNLELLAVWFRDHRDDAASAIESLVRSKPTGKYARRAWFLFEWLTESRLDLPDARTQNYVDLLEAEAYVTSGSPLDSRRHYVRNNLLGTRRLCPIVRRSEEVNRWLATDFSARVGQTLAGVEPAVLHQATQYLYTKETRASFEIEQEPLSEGKVERFVGQLLEVVRTPVVERDALVRWQNALVDPRFARAGYRNTQVYVGQRAVAGRQERVHYIAPRATDVEGLMQALFQLDTLLLDAPPLVHAAVLSFAFVFIHPFDDGNGRVHRLLIHHVLHKRGVTPTDTVLPVSAAMLADRSGYDRVLERLSKPLMRTIDYRMDEDGEVTVQNGTVEHYFSFDATFAVEALGQWLNQTLEYELPKQLAWQAAYDRARERLQRVVDLPDKLLRLLVKVTLENHGVLSKAKRASHFAMLTDEEIRRLEKVIAEDLLPLARQPGLTASP